MPDLLHASAPSRLPGALPKGPCARLVIDIRGDLAAAGGIVERHAGAGPGDGRHAGRLRQHGRWALKLLLSPSQTRLGAWQILLLQAQACVLRRPLNWS